MRILMIHNYYQQPGGEDVVFESEARLLTDYGHDVFTLTFRNDSIPEDRSLVTSGRLAATTIWSRNASERIRDTIRAVRPDVAHFHNTFPLVSASGYAACSREGVPVVQTLHNYRPLCSNAQFFRDGGVCEDCLGRSVTWPGILHACYRDSRPASTIVSAMQIANAVRGTWSNDVDLFIAINDVVRRKFEQGGFPSEAIMVKPHFVDPDPGPGDHRGDYTLFVGRLSPEKGVDVLLRAWNGSPALPPLKIIGDGPLRDEVATSAHRNANVEWLGTMPMDEVLDIIGDARLLVFPSIWQEPFGRTIIEAYARGTPVVASDIGAPLELVLHGETGSHFPAGDARSLAECIGALSARPEQLRQMGQRARECFETHFTAASNYQQLIGAYRSAIARKRARLPRTASHPAG